MERDTRLSRTTAGDADKLRSLELIVDFAACIRQLVENSIDAESTEIVVKVDISTFYISVSDNGRGVSVGEMKKLGCQRYMSSKTYTPGGYGFRGEAIHSVANLSVVEIQSRCNLSTLTSTKVISCGDTVSTVVDSSRNKHGTSIKVFDLFKNWPVRRKGMKHRVQISRIKQVLQLASLLNYGVSFTFYDIQQNKLLWNVKATTNLISRVCDIEDLSHIDHNLNDICIEYDGYQIEGVLSLSCIVEGESKPLMQEIFVNKMSLPSNNEFSQLLMSIVYDTTQNVAFVNRHAGKAPQQNLIPNFVLNISCSVDDCDVLLEPDKSNVFVKDATTVKYLLLRILHDVSAMSLEDNFVHYHKVVTSKLEKFDLHHAHSVSPLFIHEEQPSLESDEMASDPFLPSSSYLATRNMTSYTNVEQPYFDEHLETTTRTAHLGPPRSNYDSMQFDEEDDYNLSSSHVYTPENDMSSRLPYQDDFYLSTPSMVSSCWKTEEVQALSKLETYAYDPSSEAPIIHQQQHEYHKNKSPKRPKSLDFEDSFFGSSNNNTEDNTDDCMVGLETCPQDPIFRYNNELDTVQEHSYPREPKKSSSISSNASSVQVVAASKRPRLSFGDAFFSEQDHSNLTLSTSSFPLPSPSKQDCNDDETVSTKDLTVNSVIEMSDHIGAVTTSESLNSLIERSNDENLFPTVSLRYRAGDGEQFKKSFLMNDKQEMPFMKSIKKTEKSNNVVTISKQMLANAQVIAQADLKFIIARAGNSLLCIDQHAADERIQLENLERQIFNQDNSGFNNLSVVKLLEPQSLFVNKHEFSLYELHSKSLFTYGFKVTTKLVYPDDDQSMSTDNNHRKDMNEIIVESVPKIMNITLTVKDMKAILNQLNEFDPLGHGLFIKPSIFQYILCSKACRSAIMFGDKLLKEECKELVDKLSKCNFPFQCAHGRPSSILILKDIQQLDQGSSSSSGAIINNTKEKVKHNHHSLKINVSSNISVSNRRNKWKSMLKEKVNFKKLC